MYFEVNITPKEKAAAVHTDPETKYNLLLAPFQPQTRIRIETALNTTARCYLNLKNPSNRPLNIQITKKPPPERSVELNLSNLKVEPIQDVELIISWTAKESGTFRDIIQLTDSRRIKYDVALTTSTICAKKCGANGKSRDIKLCEMDFKKKVLMQNQSSRKKTESKRILNASENISDSNFLSKRHKSSHISKYQGKENICTNSDVGWQTPKRSSLGIQGYWQEESSDISVGKLNDFSMFIESDKFSLTPHLWYRNDPVKLENNSSVNSQFTSQNYTALFSPPKSEIPELRRETYITAPIFKNTTFTNENVEDGFEDSLSPQESKLNPNSDFSMLINDMNFLSKTPAAKTMIKVENVSAIDQFNTPKSNKNDTFEVLKSSEIEKSRPILSENLLDSSKMNHLVPTRLSRNFARLSPVMPVVEANIIKYATSSSPICINETEEHSNNFKSKLQGFSSFSKQSDLSSVQEVLEADLWAKPINQFSFSVIKSGPTSLESIREEALKLSPVTNKTYTKCLNETQTQNFSSLAHHKFDILPSNNNPTKKISPIRKISPKKCSKISKDKSMQEIQGLKRKASLNTSLKNTGTVSIPGVRITKLSLASLIKKKVNNKISKTSESEVSMKLHDPDDFFTILCNPDPFAATTTEDPFLASTLYYDDKWVENQEIEFKKWLNTLLTPPEHLTSNVDTPLIDVAKVWQSCRLKEDVSLAETKEAVSARYHTNQRLNTLRRAACTMLRSNEVVSVLSKVTVCVEKGILVIRKDRDLHKDIGLQKLVLELFLCYNPLWLRIGLEAIYGETIPLSSNNDIIRLSKFLLTRFFSDPYIVKTHSHQTVLNLRLPTCFTVMNKFMLKKFLFVIYFLDYAKMHKLIGHDPCLFHKQAMYKESKRILLKFSQELLSGVGDVTRVLKPYGYVLTHKQTELDEYSYAVNNLSIDLRDGVRLCRVMELITGKRSLTAICRVPAISRLQKVYNVDVALKALTSSGYVVRGNITAKCIADGHREKTLSLLWQIIYKFQAPHFNKAATTIQKWWYSKLWWVRVRNFLLKRRNNAACVIQRAWRSYLAKKQLQLLKEKQAQILLIKNRAARVIQLKWIAAIKMSKEKKRFQQLKSSAVIIQKSWKNYQAVKDFVETFKHKQSAARIIQQRWRATKLMRLQMSVYLILRDATIKIQLWWKLKLIERATRKHYQALKKATIFVQNKWRSNCLMKLDRQDYLKKLNAVRVIQRWWRCELVFRQDRNDFLLKKDAIQLIENWWLQYSAHKKLQLLLNKEINAAIILQQRWRAIQLARHQRQAFMKLKNSAIIIQRKWQANKIARSLQRSYALKRNATIILQRKWRAIQIMRQRRETFMKLKISTVIIQRRWRAKRTARSVRQSYVLKRKAAFIIQSYWRNWRVGFDARCSFLSLKAAAICVQDRFRANKVSLQMRTDFVQLKQNVIILQRKWRAMQTGRRTRQVFLNKRRAAIIIQRRYRLIIADRKHQAERQAVIKIELWWKACLIAKETKAHYDLLKSSAIIIQKKYRARKVGISVRHELKTLKNNVIFIQQKWRAKKLMQPHRKDFLTKQKAVLKIQSWWRAGQLVKITKSHYNLLKSTTILVQRKYRARKLGVTVRQEIATLKINVTYIQRKWRANKSMRLCRENFLVKRQAANKIQLWWKACLIAKETKSYYDIVKYTTILIQRRYRALKVGSFVRQEFQTLKTFVIFIQRKWRARRLMKLQREDFLAKHRAVVTIQSWWRAVLARWICQENYRKQKIAAITIQRWYRSMLYAGAVKEYYKRTISSVVIIQCWWREILLKRQRMKQRKASAATIIQAIWRGHKIRLTQSQEMTKLRERAERAAMEAQPSETLGNRLNVAINILLEYENLGKLAQGLTALDTITYLLPQGCIALCQANLVLKLYDLLYRSNRSRPWMDICLRVSSILVSIAKYAPTKSHAWQEEYVETIIRLLSATIERENSVFLHLATLLWLLADTPARIKAIAESQTTVRSLSSMYNIVSKKRTRHSLGSKLSASATPCLLPNPKPDWGLRHSRPRLFTSVHHAVHSLCKKLKIKPGQ